MVQRNRFTINRVFILLFISLAVALVIFGKLFQLQVMQHRFYAAKAEEGHLGYSEVSARRGDILIKDYHSKEVFKLATNTTFPLLFADPTLIKDPSYLADKLSPLLFDLEIAKDGDKRRIRELKRLLPDNPSAEELARINPKTEEELRQDFKREFFDKISQKTRETIILYQDAPVELTEKLLKENLPGIEMTGTSILAKPEQIGDQEYIAKKLSPLIEIPYERLREILEGRNRYVVLRQKVPPAAEQEIKKIMAEDKKAKREQFTGISFQEKNYRFYPEGALASQVIGYTSPKGTGVYGIEQSFENTLRGKKGIFKTKLDATGQQVIVGNDLIIQPAIDGDNIMLTIDRSIQMEVEKLLARQVEASRADSGMVIIMDPKTGKIVSMAHYPTFDPNSYGKALETEDITLTDAEKENIVTVGEKDPVHWLYLDADSHYRIQVFKEVMESGRTIVSKFKNILGAGVFRNRAVADLYEPGSVFKTIVMAMALDDGDVTPQTTFNDNGPLELNEFLPNGKPVIIHNALDHYNGITTMLQTLEQSLNTGMSFVARRLGRELMYRYLKKFGFAEKTDIEFDGEELGRLEEPSNWAESELVTHAFGQGIVVTPIQLISAVSALANGGILMKPQIIENIQEKDGKLIEYEPKEIRRVISEKTSATIGAMMVSVVQAGAAQRAGVPGYHIAGKTGTAQTYKNGVPLTGPGTTIASFVGFAPLQNPKFAVLVKIDRPRASIWADASAAPLFAEIAKFLFKYYDIPPDSK